jgi:hypothetical protein
VTPARGLSETPWQLSIRIHEDFPDAHFSRLDCANIVQEEALICAAILLSFLMPAAA